MMKATASLLAILFFAAFARAQENADDKIQLEAQAKFENWIKSLKFQTGKIKLSGDLATLNVPVEFKYLAPADSDKLLQMFGNPPQETLGIIFPAATDLLKQEDNWFIVLQYTEDGYVKDDDAAKINYNDLLKQMQESILEQNPERTKQGYSSIEIIGWAAPPRYDKESHKLYWAKELQFGDVKEHTLNYNIRMLGRGGVLVANAVAGIGKLGEIEAATPQILEMVDFNEGHRYADFDAKKGDKVATYGITGLIMGAVGLKVLAKVGLLALFAKKFGVFLLLLKKFGIFIIVGIAAVFNKIKSFFSARKANADSASGPQA